MIVDIDKTWVKNKAWVQKRCRSTSNRKKKIGPRRRYWTLFCSAKKKKKNGGQPTKFAGLHKTHVKMGAVLRVLRLTTSSFSLVSTILFCQTCLIGTSQKRRKLSLTIPASLECTMISRLSRPDVALRGGSGNLVWLFTSRPINRQETT